MTWAVRIKDATTGQIDVPLSELHALRVVMAPCAACGGRGNRSTATEELRRRFDVALTKLQDRAKEAGHGHTANSPK